MAIFWRAIFALFTIYCTVGETVLPKEINTAKVLILGAGATGLQAARTFHDAGMDNFIIIEGTGRIGGRVRNAEFAGMTVGFGAQWAAPENSRTVKIVKDLNLERHATNYDSLTMRNDTGHDIIIEAEANYARLEEGIDSVTELTMRLLGDAQIPDMSQRSALRLGGWEPKSAIDKVLEWFEYDFEYGETPEITSVRASSFLFNETFDMITDNRGLEEIFSVVAGFLQEPEYINHTRLNQKVITIDYTDEGSVTVLCEDGTMYVGEYALVTFSIGVLQSDLFEFIPPLPEWKNTEIHKFQMVGYTSIFMSFPSKFWGDEEWILHASDRRGYYPSLLNFQAEGLHPNGTPAMLVTCTGEESRRVEAQSPWQTKSEVEDVLRLMYGDGIPEATDILVTNWSQDPFTQGSYSNFPVEVNIECYKKLQSRVGRVFFGGEATSFEYTGYVAGGLESGEREANKLLQCFDNYPNCPTFEGDGLKCEEVVSACCQHRAPYFAGLFVLIYAIHSLNYVIIF